MKADSIGHEAGCALAAALLGLGETPLMKGDFTSQVEYEHFISDEGFYGTRLKTRGLEGCDPASDGRSRARPQDAQRSR